MSLSEVKKAYFSWWTRIKKRQLFKEMYHEHVFVQISQFTLELQMSQQSTLL